MFIWPVEVACGRVQFVVDVESCNYCVATANFLKISHCQKRCKEGNFKVHFFLLAEFHPHLNIVPISQQSSIHHGFCTNCARVRADFKRGKDYNLVLVEET